MNQHHPDGAWMCSAHGMDDQPAPKRRAPLSIFTLLAIVFGGPYTLALVVWALHTYLKG